MAFPYCQKVTFGCIWCSLWFSFKLFLPFLSFLEILFSQRLKDASQETTMGSCLSQNCKFLPHTSYLLGDVCQCFWWLMITYLFDIIHVYKPDLHNCCSLFQALLLLLLLLTTDDSPASRIWLRSLKFLASVHVKQYPETLPHWSRQITWPVSCSLVGQASSVLTCHWSKALRVIVAVLPFIFTEFVRVRASWLDSREHQKYLDFHSPNVYKLHTALYLSGTFPSCSIFASESLYYSLYYEPEI